MNFVFDHGPIFVHMLSSISNFRMPYFFGAALFASSHSHFGTAPTIITCDVPNFKQPMELSWATQLEEVQESKEIHNVVLDVNGHYMVRLALVDFEFSWVATVL